MKEVLHYTDLMKAHRLYQKEEGRYKFYDAYMESREQGAWLRSPNLPLKEGLLLFGWVHSWDPNFQGDLVRFLQIYEDIFPILRGFESQTVVSIQFAADVQNSLCVIFDRVAMCCRTTRFESTDASKVLHAIIPELFVMWDTRIRENTVGAGKEKGRGYAYYFLPAMQVFGKAVLDSLVAEKGGNYESASQEICHMAGGYTLAKLIDEFNYLRFSKRKTLAEIRGTTL